MQHTRRTLSTAVLALALGGLFAGCSSTKLDEAPVESRNVPADGATAGAGTGAGGSGTAQSNVATVDLSKQGPGAAGGLLSGPWAGAVGLAGVDVGRSRPKADTLRRCVHV